MVGVTIERASTRPDGRPRLTVTHEGRGRDLDGDALLLGAGRGSAARVAAPGRGRHRGRPQGDSGGRAPADLPAGPLRRRATSLGPPFGQFTHVARRLGREAAGNALGLDPHDVERDPGPKTIFTDPELVSLGLTEAQARGAGHDVGVGTSEFSGGKARAWGQERGLVKVVADRSSRRILGAHILAYHGADLGASGRGGDAGRERRSAAPRLPRPSHPGREGAGRGAGRGRLTADQPAAARSRARLRATPAT